MNRGLALARLVRLPNVFTALADVSVGLLLGRQAIAWYTWMAIPIVSACLYSAGMAWNDYYDRHVDRIERPQRPIPSGAITPAFAKWLGVGLTIIALLAAALAGWDATKNWAPIPLLVATTLVVAIIGYDCWLKSTWAGPWVMGSCRFFNMLLGFSVLSVEVMPWSWRVYSCLAIGLYVAGITYIARDEVTQGRQSTMLLGAAVSICGWTLLALLGSKAATFGSVSVYMVAIFGTAYYFRFANLKQVPTSEATQRFIKTALLGIIVFDAILASALAGPIGLVIVLWLIPAVILGRWVYST